MPYRLWYTTGGVKRHYKTRGTNITLDVARWDVWATPVNVNDTKGNG
jgi:hypothetical protein